MSHWLYENKKLENAPEGMVGFVYLITNKKTKRKYIGRKYFGTIKRKPLTKRQKLLGRKRRDVIKRDSDWREYMGSNKQLTADIEKLGKENFNFEILIMAETKGQVNYLEENLQHKSNVLLSDDYYNDSIGSRKFINVKFSIRLCEMIKKIP